MEDWVTIRNLKKHNPSLGTRRIAKLVGISRNTVRKALQSETYPHYEREKRTYEKLKPFHDYIKESYLIKNQRVSVIISNLKLKGYDGSNIAIYRYIYEHFKELKKDMHTKAYRPYETPPGEQMQFDWSEYKVKLGEEEVKIYVHLLICGFSRKKILNVSLDLSQSSILTVLIESLLEIGGICKRIQVDNAKQFVANASVREFKWNEFFLRFCGYYGIEPTRSSPYYPQSKGKVENPFSYVKHHFIRNNRFESFEDLFKKLKIFQEEYNNRQHSKLQSTPNELFKKEKGFLLPLPSENIFLTNVEVRKVSSDCLISYKGNRYSVPYYFVDKEVWIRSYKGLKLQAYSQNGKLIAEHSITKGKGKVIVSKAHYKDYNDIGCQNSFDSLKERFLERFSCFKEKEIFLERLKGQKRINPAYHLKKILSIFSYYENSDCIDVMEECIKYNAFSYHMVKGLIQKHNLRNDAISFIGVEIPKKQVKRSMQEYRL